MQGLITDVGVFWLLLLSITHLIGIMLIISALCIDSLFISLVNASNGNSFCYDQIGDGNHCFRTERNYQQMQKHDQIAESPCYPKE